MATIISAADSALFADVFRDAYDLAFQVSPIFLMGGIVAGVPGGVLPIISLPGFLLGEAQAALSNQSLSMQDFFAYFLPVPGSNIINQTVGTYPFANQSVAGNATIRQPLNISFRMISPVKSTAGYLTKTAIFESIKASLTAHNDAGGWYMLLTPACIFPTALMLTMTDITGGETKQVQVEWQIDFTTPLITLSAAAAAKSGLMQKLASGGKVTSPSWTQAFTSAIP